MVRIIEIDQQINTPLARAFRTIVTAGWANQSDGNVEAQGGHFALVTIMPSELQELTEAVFDQPGNELDGALIRPGAFILFEDSAGNSTLIEYASERSAQNQYDECEARYNDWMADGGMEP